MLNREACERRVYRLATLLTGNPVLATGVITAVVDAQPNLARLDNTHMDRLTVLRSREVKPGVLINDMIPEAVSRAVAALPAQQREAWIFARVYRLPMRELAKAMDCSLTATQRHLEMADAAMARSAENNAASAAQALLEYSMTLDVPAFYRAQQARRRLLRLIAIVVTIVIVLALLVAGAVLLWGRT